MNTFTAHARWAGSRLGVVGSGVFLLVLSISASRPSEASALPPLNPVTIIGKGITEVFGIASDAVGNAVVDGFVKLLEYLFGGLLATISLEFIKFLTQIQLEFGPTLNNVVGPVLVIGGFFLLLGTIASSIQAMGAVATGTDTAARAFGGLLFKMGSLAILLAAWYTIVPLAVDIANGMSSYVLSDPATNDALRKTFVVGGAGAGAGAVACGATGAACAVTPIILLILLLMLAFTIVTVLIMKYVLTFAFAALYVGGPALIGAGGFPGVGQTALNMLMRTLLVFMSLPLAWTIVFAAWAGVIGGMLDPPESVGAGLLRVLNGPGMLLAAMLVLLGVSRALLKMASPLGAPISIPGAKLAMGAMAYKMAGPAGKAITDTLGGGKGQGVEERAKIDQANENMRQGAVGTEPMPPASKGGSHAPIADLAVAGATGATAGAAAPGLAAAGGPAAESAQAGADPGGAATPGASAIPIGAGALDQARARVEGLETAAQQGALVDTQGAWSSLGENEQTHVQDLAATSLQQPEPAAHFREAMIRSTAEGRFSQIDSAAVLSSAEPGEVQSLPGGSKVAPTDSPRPMPQMGADPGRVARRNYRSEDLIGGADLSHLIPPVPPPSDD